MYPVHLMVSNGDAVTIRPMTSEDLAAIDAMHDRLSRQSLYTRYFVAYKPSLQALREQIQRSQDGGAALAVVPDSSPHEIVGMGYYLLSSDDSGVAEVALLVEDRFQGQGLGRALFHALIDAAQAQALRSFQLFILPQNQRMLRIVDQKTFPTERHYRDGMYEVRFQLGL